jgi:hypothetical protein
MVNYQQSIYAMKTPSTKVTLMIPTELWEKIKALAEKEHRPNNGQAVWMLEQMMSQLKESEQ